MKLRHTRISLAIQGALMLAMLPLAAHAQDASETKTLDTIEVTGTRIKGAELAGQVPVQTLTREDIEKTGLTSIGDLIQQISGSGSALNTKFNSSGNFGFPPDGSGVGAGATTVDLRHLGSKRVLVLVDGKRWVNESSASGVGAATDLNTIPLAIVDRIEILEDGASSLYGSDAIAGVVNIITRKNFDGFQVTAGYGQYSEGDGDLKNIDFAWGHNTDRANFFLGISHTDQNGVSSADRDISAIPIQGGSSRVPGGRFFFTDPNTGATLDLTSNAGLSNPVYDPTQTTCTRTDGFHCFAFANDAFNYAPFNYIVTPSERTGVFGQVRFNFSDNITWYAKALWNQRNSTNQAAPEPIDLGPGSGNVWNDNVVIHENNPFNPFGFRLDASNIITIRRRPLEGGPRIFEQEVDTTYFGTGLEGSFGGERTWYWDVNAAYSRNKAEQDNYGSYNARRVSLALGDPAVCAATPGCTPLDIFGFGTITPAMLEWISPVFHDESEQTLKQFSANISGELFETWAGRPFALAAGYEYREYDGEYNPDPQTVAGEYNGVPSLPTEGGYDVSELYVEANIPLMTDTFWGKALDLSLAARWSDYSTFGNEVTPKVGLRWQLADDFTMRATYAEGFRAPSIGELFGAQSRFDALLDDPCLASPDGSAPATASAANCAALGVADRTVRQIDPQVSVLTGGNLDLGPETARSFTAGFVWSPGILTDVRISEKFDIEVTYYRHTIEGGIQAIDAQTQLDLCAATLDPTYCSGITRTNSQIDEFNNFLTNLGVIRTSGWDVDFFWTLPENSWGDWRVSWQNTIVTRYEAIGAAGQRQPNGPGIVVNDSAIPEWTSNASLDWKNGGWSASWTIRHISEMEETCLAADPAEFCDDPNGATNTLGKRNYHDLQVGYRFNWMKGLQLDFGVRNLFDREPPVCTSCSLNGYEASTYDIPGGRYWYLRADVKW